MLIGEIRIVDSYVRIYDVDGSHIDITIDDALSLYEWLAKHRGRLLDELMFRINKERKKWQDKKQNGETT